MPRSRPAHDAPVREHLVRALGITYDQSLHEVHAQLLHQVLDDLLAAESCSTALMAL